jgi:predicted methyltransferase
MKLMISAALIALALPAAAQGQTVPAPIAKGLADAKRPAADKERDARSRPGEILALMDVKPGQKVADFFPGGGYWSRILATAVGPNGRVYGFAPPRPDGAALPVAALTTDYPNFQLVSTTLADMKFPEPLDAIITVQNWHDLHLSRQPAGTAASTAAKLFAALKPGGVLIVVDHAASADPEMKAPNTIHRIDPAQARKEIEAAGFKFERESKVLANAADNRTLGVFDASLRGRTDQFVHKYRKPR